MASVIPSHAVVALCSCPDQAVAEQLAHELVHRKWSACVQILPSITSIYVWQDNVCQENEVLLVIKTVTETIPAIKDWIVDAHPYDVPELIVMPVIAGAQSYMDWLLPNSIG